MLLKIKNKTEELTVRFLSFVLWLIAVLLNKFFKFKYVHIDTGRIGHLVQSELIVRKMINGLFEGGRLIGIAPRKICNKTVSGFFKKWFFIFHSDLLVQSLSYFPLKGSKFVYDRSLFRYEDYGELKYSDFPFKFSDQEEQRGWALLNKKGLSVDDWFIVIHNRDSAYLTSHMPNQNWGYHDYRDFPVSDFSKAINFVLNQGGKVVRIGARVDQRIEGMEGVIDLTNEDHDDFLDAFVTSHCLFFVGNTSGVCNLALLFNRPYLVLNYLPLHSIGEMPFDYFLPQILIDKVSGDPIAFKDYIEKGYISLGDSRDYEALGLLIKRNSPEEICELVEEVYQVYRNNRVLKNSEIDEFDETVQLTFGPSPNGRINRIGKSFIRKYLHLFNASGQIDNSSSNDRSHITD